MIETIVKVFNEYWPLIALAVVVGIIIIVNTNNRAKRKVREHQKNNVVVQQPVVKKEEPVVEQPTVPFSKVFEEQTTSSSAVQEEDLYSSVERINDLIKRQDAETHERINKDIKSLYEQLTTLEKHKLKIEKYGKDLVLIYKRTDDRLKQLSANIYSLQKLERNLNPPTKTIDTPKQEFYACEESSPSQPSDHY